MLCVHVVLESLHRREAPGKYVASYLLTLVTVASARLLIVELTALFFGLLHVGMSLVM
jgi:hypothetical protein